MAIESPSPNENTVHWTDEMERRYEQGEINALQAEIGSHAAVSRNAAHQALERAGVEVSEVTETPPYNPDRGRGDRPIDRRKLSARGRLLADSAPEHIRNQAPYPR